MRCWLVAAECSGGSTVLSSTSKQVRQLFDSRQLLAMWTRDTTSKKRQDVSTRSAREILGMSLLFWQKAWEEGTRFDSPGKCRAPANSSTGFYSGQTKREGQLECPEGTQPAAAQRHPVCAELRTSFPRAPALQLSLPEDSRPAVLSAVHKNEPSKVII